MHKVKPEDCPKLDECYKIKIVLDKEMLDFQYAETIRSVCAKCSEVQPSPDISSITFIAPGESQNDHK